MGVGWGEWRLWHHVQNERERERERETWCFTLSQPVRLYQGERERERDLVFYAQSTSVIISGRDRDRERERMGESFYIIKGRLARLTQLLYVYVEISEPIVGLTSMDMIRYPLAV